MSYASQEPWIFPGTIKQNILFGEPYDSAKYNNIINICALRTDIDQLPNGDDTVLIDRGFNLSAGQQARVNLARAVYKDADIYLLDDSLSSLDTNVSRFIFNNCIKDYLKEKLCIIVMQQTLYLEEIDKILYIKDGKVYAEGNYEEIITSKYGDEMLKNQIDYEQDIDKIVSNERNERRTSDIVNMVDCIKLDKRNVYYEEKKEGKIDWEIFKIYFKSGKRIYILLLSITFYMIASGCGTYFDYFVTKWTDAEETIYNLTEKNMTDTIEYDAAIERKNNVPKLYTTLITIIVLLNVLEVALYYQFTMSVSINLHNNIFSKIMRATMEFFDLHLSGNILNRFAKDMTQIDEGLPHTFHGALGVSHYDLE